MAHNSLDELLSPAQVTTVEWLLARVASTPAPPLRYEELVSPSWRSQGMARIAIEMAISTAGPCSVLSTQRGLASHLRCTLEDARRRNWELTVSFESDTSGRIARIGTRPMLAEGMQVRRPTPDDLPAMAELELAAPVQRDDGTKVVIDHNGKQFEHESVLLDHRWLAVFNEGRMLAVQAVALVEAPVNGRPYRFAYNHYSRSDPRTRNAGNLMYLVTTLYQDIFPVIDQFASIVDVKNSAGLRLSFGTPWPTRVRRLFLPIHALAAREQVPPTRRPFDTARAAHLLNQTHAGMTFWVPRTPEFLARRISRAPAVYAGDCWRLTEHAALALWPSGERRTYQVSGAETRRTLALVLDYGFAGETGQAELTGLLSEAARELAGQAISHIALFVSDGHPATQWLVDLAEASDVYAICAPPLDDPPASADPIYTDHILF